MLKDLKSQKSLHEKIALSASKRRNQSWQGNILILFINSLFLERQSHAKDAEEDYHQSLRDLAKEDGVTQEDVDNYKKTVLIQKSIDDVK